MQSELNLFLLFRLQRSQSLTFSDSDLKGSDKRELKQLSDEVNML